MPDSELLPCPFCGAGLVLAEHGECAGYWFHPGAVTDDDCLLSGWGYRAAQLPTWNTRHATEAIAADRLARTQAGGDPLRDALQAIVSGASDTYRKRNGHIGSIEADDGEKCWIVHSDLIFDAERALATPTSSVEVEREAAEPDYCEECDDSGWVVRGPHREICGCACGQDVHRQHDEEARAIRSRPLPSDRGEVADLKAVREAARQQAHIGNYFNGYKLLADAIDAAFLARTALSTEGGEHGE